MNTTTSNATDPQRRLTPVCEAGDPDTVHPCSGGYCRCLCHADQRAQVAHTVPTGRWVNSVPPPANLREIARRARQRKQAQADAEDGDR